LLCLKPNNFAPFYKKPLNTAAFLLEMNYR
jgi:hypothetical protein